MANEIRNEAADEAMGAAMAARFGSEEDVAPVLEECPGCGEMAELDGSGFCAPICEECRQRSYDTDRREEAQYDEYRERGW